MSQITDVLTADHRHCDAQFADMEDAVNDEDWSRAAELFNTFRESLNRHLDFEEQVLFPALEEDPNVPDGPVGVMTMEHQEMRNLVEQMQFALDNQDEDMFLGQSETLLILLQQHNVKEEQILYPAGDNALAPDKREMVLNQAAEWGLEKTA